MRHVIRILLFLAVIVRLILLFSLPLWIDETYTLHAIQLPLINLIGGHAGLVPISGYYVFLAVLDRVWDNPYWLRFSTFLFFSANIILIRTVGKKILDSKYSDICVFLYIFSGYFVIFDWQMRMYTGTTTLILLSLITLFIPLSGKNKILFTLVLFVGLLYDYSFIWYFIALIVYLLIRIMFYGEKDEIHRIFLSLLSFIAYLPWVIMIKNNIPLGIQGITWLKPYISPNFTVPYFLGTHQFFLLIPPILTLIFIGIISIINKIDTDKIAQMSIAVLITGDILYLYSIFVTPIFHQRSLQIVGIIILLLTAKGIYYLQKNKSIKPYFWYPIFIASFIGTIWNIYFNPGLILLKF